MVALRNGAAGLVLTLALFQLGSAGPPGAGGVPNGGGKPAPKLKGLLLPRMLEGSLQLDATQREKIAKLEAEFKQRRQGVVLMTGLKLKGVLDRLDDDDPRAGMPVLTLAGEVTAVLQKMRKLKLEYEKKAVEVLNDEQRAAWRVWNERSPREKRADRKASRKDRTESRLPVPDFDKELQLTPEQHKKLADMERDWEARFRQLLTPEQRRRYEELTGTAPKKGAPGEEKAPAPE